LSYASPDRPIVSLDELSSLECALIGATATTKAIIASKGTPCGHSRTKIRSGRRTIRAFSSADSTSPKPPNSCTSTPNTVRYRLEQIASKTGYEPRHFGGLVDLICILETIDDDQHLNPAV